MIDARDALSGVGALLISTCAVLALRPIAFAVDLLDRPGGHKLHHGIVPLIGGVGMLLGIVFGLAANPLALGTLQQYVFSAVLLVVVGMLDDRFTLSPGIRLVAQFAAVLPMFFSAGVRLTSFGDLFGTGPLNVPGSSLVATAIVTIAAINAFNMLDGMDGLAGGIAFVAGLLMLFGSVTAGDPSRELLAAVLCGSVAGFLVFNLPVRWNRGVRCFMGDAGSTLLGFSMAWLTIGASQGEARMAAPVTMVWLVAVPATDLVWTVVRRASRGQSPFRPDNEHLHHLLLRAGFGVRAVFFVMTGISVVFGLTGLLLDRSGVSEPVSFVLLICGGAGLVILGRHATLLSHRIPTLMARRGPIT